jgi:hypothetical protein
MQVVRYYPNFDKAFQLLKALALERSYVCNAANERVPLEVGEGNEPRRSLLPLFTPVASGTPSHPARD